MTLRHLPITILGIVVLSSTLMGCEVEGGTNPQSTQTEELIVLWQQIQSLFMEDNFQATIERIDQYLKAHKITEENLGLLIAKAEAHSYANEQEKAIESLEKALPLITKMNNVARRKYSHVYFSLGHLYDRKGKYPTAARYVKDGLVLEPQHIYQQIFLGELYRLSGKPELAVSHLRSLEKLPTLKEEERLVIRKKIHRMTNVKTSEWKKVDFSHARVHEGMSYKIVPINQFGSRINLEDLCLLLKSKYFFPCDVLPPLELDEKIILDTRRNQYNGDKIHDELLKRYPDPANRAFFVIAVTDRDIYGKNTNYVFSWQDRNWKIGVISTFRFIARLDDFYEIDVIPTRRLGIQFLSTVGSLHKFSRPISPNCPLAYPNDFSEFLGKTSKLCESTIAQRNSTLKKFGDFGRRFTTQEVKEINRVYATYQFR